MSENDEKSFFKSDSRIALLEKSIAIHEREISDIKQNHRDMMRLVFDKLDAMKDDMHELSLSLKDVVTNQLKDSNKNKLWMLGIIIGFVSQIAVGLILLKKGIM